MQEMTKQEILKLQQQTGHELVVHDIELLEELDRAAEQVALTTTRERRLLMQPYSLCGVKFYPLTVAKTMWFKEQCEEWEVSEQHQEGLLLWMLTLENTAEALDEYSDQRKANRAAKRLARRLHCSQDELTTIYTKCVRPSSTGQDSEGKTINYGGLVAVLLREYGGTVDKWLYETPVEVLGSLMTAYEDRVTREQEASRASARRSGKAIAPTPTKRIRALKVYRDIRNRILELWSEEDGKEQTS